MRPMFLQLRAATKDTGFLGVVRCFCSTLVECLFDLCKTQGRACLFPSNSRNIFTFALSTVLSPPREVAQRPHHNIPSAPSPLRREQPVWL